MHMFWHDSSLQLRAQVARQTFEFVERFCRAADRRMMRAREEAFLATLNEWAQYAIRYNKREAARCEKVLEGLIQPMGKAAPSAFLTRGLRGIS